MKNVLVFYSHNFSANYLGDQELKHELAPNFDSARLFEPSESDVFGFDAERAARVREGLQSIDGQIQYWHFKQGDLRYDLTKPIDKCDIDYWVEKLKENLPEGETLDALVLPTAFESECPELLAWIRDLKAHFPSLKVIKHDPYLRYQDPATAEQSGRFAWALTPEAGEIPGYRPLILTGNTGDYRLAEGIDVVAKNINGTASANLLRTQLRLPQIPQQGRGY